MQAPPDATKKSHPHIHERYKVGCLGAQYSMQHVTLAQRLGISTFAAHEMLSQHRGLFSTYWTWVEDWIAHALNTGSMHTAMGWTCVVGITELNARSIGNWPVQATGADILRIACIEGHRRGLKLCGSVHDAVLIESSLEQIDADVALMQEIMRRASRIVLGDHELRTGVDIVRYPDRYYDARGIEMWKEVLRLLEQYQHLKEERTAVSKQSPEKPEARPRRMGCRDRSGVPACSHENGQRAKRVEAEGLAAKLHPGAEGMGAAAAGSKTDQHLPPGARAPVPALVWQGEARHRFQQGGAGGKNLRSIEMGCARRAGTAGPDRGRSQAAKVTARRSAPHPVKTNMSVIAHSHMRASAPEITRTCARSRPRGPYSLFLFSQLTIGAGGG